MRRALGLALVVILVLYRKKLVVGFDGSFHV